MMLRLRNEVSYHGLNSRVRARTASSAVTCVFMPDHCDRSDHNWYSCQPNAPNAITAAAAAANPTVASRPEL
jgi:hypothetical protein